MSGRILAGLKRSQVSSITQLNQGAAPRGREFVTTRWSVVLQAGDSSVPQGQEALESLCEAYWYPVYAWLRSKGQPRDEALDLAQAFFADVLRRGAFGKANPQRGKFRTFLLSSLNNFVMNEAREQRAIKRGGGVSMISLDEREEAEERFLAEPSTRRSPDFLYERRWIETMLARVMDELKHEATAAGHGERFETLKVFLVEDKKSISFADAAAKVGQSESAVKSLVFRLRRRWRELFRAEVLNTVADEGQVDDEIRHLLTALADPD